MQGLENKKIVMKEKNIIRQKIKKSTMKHYFE